MATAEQEVGTAVVVGSIGQQTPAPFSPPVSMMDFVREISTPQALQAAKEFANAYNKVCAALIGDDDVQRADGKLFKKKSAWRKLGRFFRVSTDVIHVEKGFRTDESTGAIYYYAEVHVRGTAPWGQSMTAIGACDTREARFGKAAALAKAGNDVLATAETRATNRATSNLIAAGEVSAEEMEGSDRGGRQEQGEVYVTMERIREVRAECVALGAWPGWLKVFDKQADEPHTEAWVQAAVSDLKTRLAERAAKAPQPAAAEPEGVTVSAGAGELPFGTDKSYD